MPSSTTRPSLRRVSPAASCSCACHASGGGEAPKDKDVVARLLDLEAGAGHAAPPDHTASSRRADQAMAAKQTRRPTDDDEMFMSDLNRAAVMAIKCVVRGMVIVLWLDMMDFVRRLFSIHTVGAIIAFVFAMFISVILWIASESLDELREGKTFRELLSKS